MLNNSSDSYGSFSKAMHWAMALVIIALVVVGTYMSDLGREDPLRRELIGLHKDVGVLAMLLIIVRLAWLRRSPAPKLPAVFTDKEVRVVSMVKTSMYVLMVLLPVSGYFMSITAGYAVSFFGLFDLPSILGKSHDLHEVAEIVHAIMGKLMILAVIVHVAGTIKHRVKDKNSESDVLQRML